jgi:hypothetical protein
MGFAVRSPTIQRPQEPLVSTDLRIVVRPIAISLRSFTLASTRVHRDQLKPIALPRVIMAQADRAIPLFNLGRSLAVVRSPEARKDRTRRSPARPPPWRCPADCPAVRSASYPAAPIGRPTDANDRRAIGMRGPIPRLTFRAGHGCFTDSASISLALAGMAVSASMASSNGWIRLIPFPAITPNSAA